MKKALIGMLAVTFVALMMTSAYAQCIPIPTPPYCECDCPGFTPGFWKHNIEVYLGLTNGAYSAFEGGPLDGVKLNATMMETYLWDIRWALGDTIEPYWFTFELALSYLKGKGWSADRTNVANWFNHFAGYGWYVD